MDRITTLEADLHRERNTTTDLETTLCQERLTFEKRMLKMEQAVAALTGNIILPPPPPPPPHIPKPTLTPAQLEMIAKNRQAAIKLRESKLPATRN